MKKNEWVVFILILAIIIGGLIGAALLFKEKPKQYDVLYDSGGCTIFYPADFGKFVNNSKNFLTVICKNEQEQLLWKKNLIQEKATK